MDTSLFGDLDGEIRDMSNNILTLSVVMPVYNSEQFLREAVDSVLAQTYQDFEFIIIDDGSTDRSPLILNEYAQKDQRIRLVTQKNQGVAQALNCGIEIARGRYIARMDADDICFLDRFRMQIDYLEAHSDVAVVGAQAVHIDDEGRELKFYDRLPCTPLRVACRMVSLWGIYHPLVMFRTEVVRLLGGYRDICPGQDVDLWLRVSQNARIANLKEVLLKYRVHSKSVTQTRRRFVRSEVYPDYTQNLFGIPADIARPLYSRKMFFFVLPWLLCSMKKIASRFGVHWSVVLFCREFVDAWMVLAWKQDPITTVFLVLLKGIVSCQR